MRQLSWGWFVGILVFCVLSPSAVLASVCPPGYALGGGECQPLELCSNGRPAVDGDCSEGSVLAPSPVPRAAAKQTVPQGSAPRKCEVSTIFHTGNVASTSRLFWKREQRSVLLLNGDAVSLFDRYIADVKRSARALDYQNLVISYVDNAGKIVPALMSSLTFEEILGAVTYQQKWRERLRGVRSRDIANAERFARENSLDVVCGR